ncbi:enoyl-CoA hydratase-related protein [Paracoccus mutanolyticus]|uniref:enoyl-CoA hydratase-related protein n=1 Tax=Paracoccus mutanolyticus TaxID=1499308 RepID=UPI0021D51F94|nr:enoyl-CoA hydratase-related protein [Paracoccus mutanolyticus]
MTQIALNRPQVMNALNRTMRAEITAALTDLRAGTRCVVLTGTGRAFCSGQDLTDASAGLDVERVLREEFSRCWPRSPARRCRSSPGHGSLLGGGEPSLADDLVIGESARFVQALSRIGLIPDAGGTFFVPRAAGLARAMGMMLLAEPVTARQAADWGMIWEAVPDDAFQDRVQSRAQALAQGPTRAYLAIRQALLASGGNGLADQLALEAGLQGQMGQTSDFAEGVAAFLEKRPAQFSGN